jgi:hypothetical protein
MDTPRLGIRWTIGDVSEPGFKALQLSVWGASRVFGDRADYAICVNSISVKLASEQVGPLPVEPRWIQTDPMLPQSLHRHLNGSARQNCWRFAPLRLFPESYEIALDNDLILWEMPLSLRDWLRGGDAGGCLMAEDIRAAYGQFADYCPPHPRNAGLRGMPPGFDPETAMCRVLKRREEDIGHLPSVASAIDTQGLLVASLSSNGGVRAVALHEVTMCSPFQPHLPYVGSCGAHFVGLNARHIPWSYYGRPAGEWMREHWGRHQPELQQYVGMLIPTSFPAEHEVVAYVHP